MRWAKGRHSLGYYFRVGRLMIVVGKPRKYGYGQIWYSPLTVRWDFDIFR